MSAWPATVRTCIDEAIALAPRWLACGVDAACTSLQQQARDATGLARQELTAAAADLAHERMSWCAAIGAELKKAIETDDEPARPALRVSPSSLTLTLVDDSDVLESIESSRLAMELDACVEKQLAELDKYMSAALGLEAIQPEDNPLRPAVFARAVRSVMNDSEFDAGELALWMKHLAEPLGAELKLLYEKSAKTFARAGVKPAGYRISSPAPLTTREGRTSAGAPLRPVPASQPRSFPYQQPQQPQQPPAQQPQTQEPRPPRSIASSWVEFATRPINGPVLREFLFGAQPQQSLAPAYYQQVDQELAALEARWDEAPPDPEVTREYKHLPAVERPVREVGTASPLSREIWGRFSAPRQRSLVRTRLRKEAKEVGQVMGLDLVRQLLDQVAQDPRLLAPVREAMVALEPALARLALKSPRFASKQDDPARKMLEAVAQRSFKYNDEFASEFREFFDDVKSAFNELNRIDALQDAAPFEHAHAKLERTWSQQDKEDEQHGREMMEAVRFAEERQSEADRVAWEMSQRADLAGAPSVVQDFLFGPWSLVIAHARLRGGGNDMDPGGFIRVIADLLWSVKRETTLRDPARAFEIIPRVLPTLRAGLQQLGHPPGEADTFFHALERLHRPVLRLRAKHRQASLHSELAAAPLDADLQPAPAQKPKARDDMWMHDGELRACGFGDTVASDFAVLEAEPGLSAAAAERQPAPVIVSKTIAGVPMTDVQADAVIAALLEGSWVDLFSKQQWRRAQLTWASGKRTLFMFVSHGGRPHSMTRRSLQRLVIDRLLRPVASHEVVQHALDTLVQARSEPRSEAGTEALAA